MQLAWLVLLAACTPSPSATAPANATGHEREPCGSGCNAGLTCLSDRCVRVPGVDCGDIAETLASIELGNYAEPEVRAPRVAALRETCDQLNLSKSDGECILAARTRDQIARCPQPIIVAALPSVPVVAGPSGLPPECTQYVAVLERWAACPKLPAETRAALKQATDAVKQSWSQLGSGAMPATVGDACRQGIQAIEQGMKQFGC